MGKGAGRAAERMGCEAMGQVDVATQAGVTPPQPKRCPLCGAMVAADPLGLYACSCGWGGPGDPLEHDRGLAKLVAKMPYEIIAIATWIVISGGFWSAGTSGSMVDGSVAA